jgi:uncharacterized protein
MGRAIGLSYHVLRRTFPHLAMVRHEKERLTMQCPVDGTTLVMADRQGVEIDYCPQCRGVWLDRGELDKIIERSVPAGAPSAAPAAPAAARGYAEDHRGFDKKKRRGSFLDDIFDF